MDVFLNLRYRATYIRRFLKCAKILGLPISCRLLKACYKGANPKIFCDSAGGYRFNQLIASYLDRFRNDYLRKRYREISLSDYDLKVLAINYSLLEMTGLAIMKYIPHISYTSMLKLNTYLYALKDVAAEFRGQKRKNP